MNAPRKNSLPLIGTALFVLGTAAGAAAVYYWTTQRPPDPSYTKPSPQPSLSGRAPDEIVSAPPGGFDPEYVKTAKASMSEVADVLPLAGKLAFNAERTHQAAARVAGRVDRIFVFDGRHIGAGEPVAEIFSPDYIAAQQEYLLARNMLRTIKTTNIKELAADAEATLQASRQKLRVLGANDQDVSRIEQTGAVAQHLAVRAPIGGVVTKRNADPGQYLNFGDSVLAISDTSRLWFLGNIYEQDYSKVRIGQQLQLESPALPDRRFTGTVDFIAPGIDPATHVLAIRCNVPNPGGALRPEMFVNARLVLGKRQAILLPKAALVQRNDVSFVIVDLGDGRYQRVRVTGIALDGHVAITTGLKGGEQVVVEGAVLVSHLIDLEQS